MSHCWQNYQPNGYYTPTYSASVQFIDLAVSLQSCCFKKKKFVISHCLMLNSNGDALREPVNSIKSIKRLIKPIKPSWLFALSISQHDFS